MLCVFIVKHCHKEKHIKTTKKNITIILLQDCRKAFKPLILLGLEVLFFAAGGICKIGEKDEEKVSFTIGLGHDVFGLADECVWAVARCAGSVNGFRKNIC